MNRDELQHALQDFHGLGNIEKLDSDDALRVTEQPRLVSRFYDAVTSFYEFGWGATFHFSPRRPGENLRSSQQRHEEGIAKLLRIGPKMIVADVGCGVGGPLITIGRSTGAKIVGINFNAYQIQRGEKLIDQAGLGDSCSFLYADFMDVPLKDGTFDALYSFEAICHAPDRKRTFCELFRLLKPGAEAAFIDWTLTDKFDASNTSHVQIRAQIERNNATPDLLSADEYVAAVESAGFEVVEKLDQQVVVGDPSTPWYMALEGRDFSISSAARTPVGRSFTAVLTRILERLKLAPKGTSETSRILNAAADSLTEAGKLGIFTPSFLVHARKPS
ncbi:MAG: methyltransferase domain-containing protein [Gammaproteobacteria bacterium]|nr:methyltransferase domain-containing protein [Gammaproteobacteria bacterium]